MLYVSKTVSCLMKNTDEEASIEFFKDLYLTWDPSLKSTWKNNIAIHFFNIYSAGEEKSPYFLFHGETALRKNLKISGRNTKFLREI